VGILTSQKHHVMTTEPKDLVVIGGGSAGICAAIAAARTGARVALLERSGCLGGMGTLAKVHTFCGLYDTDVSRPPRLANPGLPAEIEARMRELTGATPVKMGKVHVLPQDPETFARIASELTTAEPTLEVWCHTECTAIARQPDRSFTVQTGARSITCRAIVDTSADAIAAPLLGATRIAEPAATTQRAASIFSMENVSPGARDEGFRMRLALDIVRAVIRGELPAAAMGTACRASVRPGEIYFTIDLDPAPLSELMATGRLISESLAGFLRNRYPEYAAATGPFPATTPGVRESFRWLGQYTLTADDLLTARVFDDPAAYATWPIELRETTRGPRFQFLRNPAQIPLRCLISAEIDGVFFAGRCLSATHQALASVRVMGTCFATGQAAGIAAATYCRTSPALGPQPKTTTRRSTHHRWADIDGTND